ncbi:MAG TPA: response regulator transcription factor [Candidatus Acidoferrum sp.]|nr:response regulator transcription factor [Candidatus Acidoferrum sp.]
MKGATTLSVAIVEDDDRFRKSLARWIENTPGLRCAGHCATAEAALKLIPGSDANVVIMDINLPAMSGIECVRLLKAQKPELQIVMLTVYEDSDLIFRALQAGANGYLLKRSSPDQILEAIVDVSQGGAPMSSHIARKVVQSFQSRGPADAEQSNLTQREEEILGYVIKGFSNKEIADALKISVETIRVHLKNIYEKLHVRSRTEAALKRVGEKTLGNLRAQP